MASIALLRRFGTYALAGGAAAAWLSHAQADEPAGPCGNAVSILNEGKAYEAFDKKNGGGDERLRFRLDGKEPNGKAPCAADGCKAENKPVDDAGNKPGAKASDNAEVKPDAKAAGKVEAGPEAKAGAGVETRPEVAGTKPAGNVEAKADTRVATKVEIVAGAAASGKVIATIDLTGRTASYCVYGLSRVDATPGQRRNGCPPSYLVNFLAVKLVDGDGPFARRDVTIQYMYHADAGAGGLAHCTVPAVFDGMFRRRAWTVALDDGATAFIGETDFPRDRRTRVPQDPPYATSVSGAR